MTNDIYNLPLKWTIDDIAIRVGESMGKVHF